MGPCRRGGAARAVLSRGERRPPSTKARLMVRDASHRLMDQAQMSHNVRQSDPNQEDKVHAF